MRWLTGNRWANEPHLQFWRELSALQEPRYLHGYWQTERYFLEHSDQIPADYAFRMVWDAQDVAIRRHMRAQLSASLHLFRSDYTNAKNQKFYAVCDLDYYLKAICLLRERVPDVKLFVFSDDPDWVDSHLGTEFGPIEMVRHNSCDRSV